MHNVDPGVFDDFNENFVKDNKQEIAEFLINHKANFIIFVHTHQNCSAQPSCWDLKVFCEMHTITDALSIVVFENIIIGKNDIFSLKSKSLFEKHR